MNAPKLRTWQLPVMLYRGRTLILNCGRQLGKSTVLAHWSVARMLQQLAKHPSWTIVCISNSRNNGIEFGHRVREVLQHVKQIDELLVEEGRESGRDILGGEPISVDDFSQKLTIRIGDRMGRLLILAASARTARGFSADVILDEFAFQQDAEAIWDAVSPISSSNPEFVIRISSTHAGEGTLFHRFVTENRMPKLTIRRSDVWHMGNGSQKHLDAFREQWTAMDPAACKAWLDRTHGKAQPHDRIRIASMYRTNPDGSPVFIDPDEALAEAGHAKASFLQNFECEVMGNNDLPFLSWDLITKSMTAPHFDVDAQSWSQSTIERAARSSGSVFLGLDFARTTDLSVVSVLTEQQGQFRHIARLEMQGVDSRTQRQEVARMIRALGSRVDRVTVDATGPGVGISDELIADFGSLVLPINFATTVPIDPHLVTVGEKRATMYVSERMALDMQRLMEDRKLELPFCEALRDDLRKPTRVLKGGRVLVAAARDASGHADRMWSLALALHGYFAGNLGGWDMAGINAVEVGAPEFDGFFSRW